MQLLLGEEELVLLKLMGWDGMELFGWSRAKSELRLSEGRIIPKV